MHLTSQNVDTVFRSCLWSEEDVKMFSREELIKRSILIKGVVINIGFRPEGIEKHRESIILMLSDLSADFDSGSSFLLAAQDKFGNMWGEHRNVDQLICLGLAIDRIEFMMERELWDLFPGGVPYFKVKRGDKDADA